MYIFDFEEQKKVYKSISSKIERTQILNLINLYFFLLRYYYYYLKREAYRLEKHNIRIRSNAALFVSN
jgi:hypothetical protein